MYSNMDINQNMNAVLNVNMHQTYKLSLQPITHTFNKEEINPLIFKEVYKLAIQFVEEANSQIEEERKKLSPELSTCNCILSIIFFFLIIPFIILTFVRVYTQSKATQSMLTKLRSLSSKYNPQFNEKGVHVFFKEEIDGHGKHSRVNLTYEFSFGEPMGRNQTNGYVPPKDYTNVPLGADNKV